MRLEGSLDAFSLPDIFALLSMTKKTGGLHLRRDGRHGAVWLRDGSLTGGRSQIGRQSLARRVVLSSDLDSQAVDNAIQTARDNAGPLLPAILKLDLLDLDMVRSCAHEQIIDVVFDLLRWDAGDFEFVVDESNPDEVDVARSVDEVVGDARHRLAEWETAQSSLPMSHTVLHLRAVAPAEVMLEHDQWSLLVLADGRRTVAEIVDLSGRGEFAAVRALGELVHSGLLCEPSGGAVAHVVERGLLLDGFEGQPVGHIAAEPVVEPEPVPEVAEVMAVLEELHVEAEPVIEEVHDFTTEPEIVAIIEESVPEVIDEPVSEQPVQVDVEVDDESAYDVESDPNWAEVTELPAQPFRSVGRDLTSVTPQRPEPFIPARQPEHAESVSVTTTTHGSLAAAAAPAPHIERDPSVNKSLLLRLIAGVRGL